MLFAPFQIPDAPRVHRPHRHGRAKPCCTRNSPALNHWQDRRMTTLQKFASVHANVHKMIERGSRLCLGGYKEPCGMSGPRLDRVSASMGSGSVKMSPGTSITPRSLKAENFDLPAVRMPEFLRARLARWHRPSDEAGERSPGGQSIGQSSTPLARAEHGCVTAVSNSMATNTDAYHGAAHASQ